MEIEKKLHEVDTGIFAYTQLPGSWGWSNAGLIVDGDQSLLVDTLFDRRIAREMLEEMRRATPAAQRIGTFSTHWCCRFSLRATPWRQSRRRKE